MPGAAGRIGRLVLWGAVGVSLVAARSAWGQSDEEEAARIARDMAWGRAMSLPEGGTFEISELVRMTMGDGRLSGECHGPTQTVRRVDVVGSEAAWTFSRERTSAWGADDGWGGGWGRRWGRFGNGAAIGIIETSGGEVWRLTRVAAAAGEPQQITLSGTAGVVQLEVTAVFRGVLERAVLSQMRNGVFFDEMPATGRRWGGGPRMALARGRILHATGLFTLKDQDPEAFAALVKRPMELMGAQDAVRPGWTEVYRHFTDIRPDPAEVARVRELVSRLDAPLAAERAAASAGLEALGKAGVLAAVRIDTGELSAEQRARVAAFLAAHDHGAAAGRSERALLTDCLEVPDEAVVAAARKELAAMEK